MRKQMEQAMEEIRIPENLNERWSAGVRRAAGQRRRLRRQLAAAAALVCALSLSHPTVAAGVRGFFEDVVRWDGAVTGTAYTPGEGELALRIDGCTVTIEAANRQEAPFSLLDGLALKGRILTGDGTEAARIESESPLADGCASFALESLPPGAYRLCVDSLQGTSRADAPLEIRGEWEIAFEIE